MGACLGLDGDFGNPASADHLFGRRAAGRVEAARAQVAALLGAEPDELLFTSGATESNNLALLGVARANGDRGRHLVTSRIEHKAVLDPCKRLEKEGFSVTYVTPDSSGRIAPEAVRAALRSDTILVSIMFANNETGVLQDVVAIGEVCRERGIVFHTDAAQAVGKVPVQLSALPVDLLSLTAHKLYGPKGVGALYVRHSARPLLQAINFGGGQERGLRPGTLPTHQIVGLGVACELAGELRAEEAQRVALLRERLWGGIEGLAGLCLNGGRASRVPGILNVSFEGVEGESLVTGLSSLAVSTGSACNSASGEPSYVLRALGRSTQLAESSLRFSLGRFTTEADIDFAVEAVNREVRRLRAVAPDAERWASAPDADRSTARGRAERFSAPWQGPPASRALSPLTWKYFRSLPGAGAPPGGEGLVVTGEAGGRGEEVWVRFHLRVDGDIVKDAHFQAYGCPHTLAVAAWLTEQLPGRTLEDLIPGAPAQWAQTLSVPVEKLGRLLRVEDALRACCRPRLRE
jgi:cysteine desulfurase